MLLCAGWGPPAPDPPPSEPQDPESDNAEDPFAEPPPRDPDDTPFMSAPNNQLGQWSVGRKRTLTRSFDDDHHLQLTVAPAYAAFHVSFIGRGNGPFRGVGAALELDLRVFRWLFVRAFASHTAHPVFAESAYNEDDGSVAQLSESGLIQATNTGLSLVYALDIGRFVPRLDLGGGLLFVRSPTGPQDGQWGQPCASGNVCDLGLYCSAEEVCRPATLIEVHAGVALDVLIARHWAAGLGVRYTTMLSTLDIIPIYLQATIRLSARF